MTGIERHRDEEYRAGREGPETVGDDPRFAQEHPAGVEAGAAGRDPGRHDDDVPGRRAEAPRDQEDRPAVHPELMGRTVIDRDGEMIGTIDGVYVDEDDTPRYVAVDTGWFGEERHVIPVDGMRRRSDGTLTTPADKRTIADGPRGVGNRGLTVDDLAWVHEHYGLESIDMLLAARQTTPAPTPEIAKAEIASAIRSGRDPAEVVVRRWGV